MWKVNLNSCIGMIWFTSCPLPSHHSPARHFPRSLLGSLPPTAPTPSASRWIWGGSLKRVVHQDAEMFKLVGQLAGITD